MNTLVVLLGPTAVGKTSLSLALAERLHSPVINCDSRQIYRDMEIGTAPPSLAQRNRVPHFFVATCSLTDYYSAARYEADVLQLCDTLWPTHPTLLMSGGSMMYIDAVCQGIDDIPTVDETVRQTLRNRFMEEGLDPLLRELRLLDPDYYRTVDLRNHKRVIHALEICYTAGRPYSSFRTQKVKPRPFSIRKIGLRRDRQELFSRINRRVDQMMADGLLEEARRLYPYRHLNALNTVGYKELFQYIEGQWPLDMAVERIKKNTRVYAKKQMTWFQRDESIHWFHPDQIQDIFKYLQV
ncbi:MAG: tRNA (adenosine(37)-N6)-dimethylallyltransferase MiaA [Bacteroidaceae bacterium]